MVGTSARPDLTSSANVPEQRDLRLNRMMNGSERVIEAGLPDEQIIGFVRQALLSTGYQHFRNLNTYCHHGRVTLQGCLPTYFLKQVAQVAILAVVGVRDIDNDVKVHSR